jgi:feruloyl-CoA synthase
MTDKAGAGRDRALFADAPCTMVPAADGAFVLRSSLELAPHKNGIYEILKQRAAEQPDKVLYFESDRDGIVGQLTFGQAYDSARRIGRTFLELGASLERPVALVADNSIQAAVAILGCYAAGVPVAPISTSYSRLSTDYGKLRYLIEVLTPSVVIFDDGAAHAGAIASVPWRGAMLAAMKNEPAGALSWDDLLDSVDSYVDDPSVDPDRVAKILFTSGSTGMPKGVINTQRMMVSNQYALAQVWPGVFEPAPRLVDWLPWNHTYGGNQLFNMPIVFGGSLTIDRGRPTEAGIATMIQSIIRTRPTVFMNVPRALDMLADRLDRDADFAAAMFSELELVGYAGAALPPPVAQKLSRVARKVKGRDIPIVGLWGSTETAPVVTAVYFASGEPANIGLPVPGVELKFSPDGTKYEMRVRGANVTPGYWRQPDATAKAFDEGGYYRMGDAGRLVDANDVNAGLLFDGRVAENFKLLSGTWVNVGSLRVKVIGACVDLISDVVIAGHNREEVCALIFPKADASRRTADTSVPYLSHPEMLTAIRDALRVYNAGAGGSSNRIARALVLREPPSIDAGEITDKGYLNQRAVLERRADLVDLLYADTASAGIIDVESKSLAKTKESVA